MHFFSAKQERAGLMALLVFLAGWTFGQAAGAEEAVHTAKPKVLEFYASWCEPCKRLEPVMERARAQYSEEVEFVSVDVDDPKNKELLEQYDVCPIPSVVFVDSHDKISSYAIGCTEERNIRAGLRKLLPQTVISTATQQTGLN